MLIKLIKFFLSKLKILVDFIIIVLFRIKLLPKQLHKKARVKLKIRQYQKDFNKLKLVYNSLGFFYVDPIPSQDYLSSFYAETYWDNRVDKNFPVRKRDIEHYKLLLKIFPNFNETSKNILNFGSGHCGISILLHLKNHKIVNFDYYKGDTIFEKNWRNVDDITQINEPYDLIYSSHSLEHVQNIFETVEKFREISHDETIFFFEVPNCFKKEYQKIHMPHTYYFKKSFFDQCFKKLDFFKSYLGEKELDNVNEGNILRILTKGKIQKLR